MKFHIWKNIFHFRAAVDATNINGRKFKVFHVYFYNSNFNFLTERGGEVINLPVR